MPPTLASEFRCQAIAPFDLPYTNQASAWAAQMRWTQGYPIAPTFVAQPLWRLSTHGFPGLNSDPHFDLAQLERQLEAHQLAYLENTVGHVAVDSVEQLLDHTPWLNDRQLLPQALGFGLYGPLSLGLTLVDDQERPLLADQRLREVLTQHLHLRIGWLARELRIHDIQGWVCLIEPFWNAQAHPFSPISQAEAYGLLAEAIQHSPIACGIAPTGSAVDWPLLINSGMRVLVCSKEQRQDLLACGKCINDYLENGGAIIWECLPSDPTQLAEIQVSDVINEWTELLREALDHDILNSRMLDGSLLTIAHGLAQHEPSYADQALGLLAEVSRVIRTHYKLQ